LGAATGSVAGTATTIAGIAALFAGLAYADFKILTDPSQRPPSAGGQGKTNPSNGGTDAQSQPGFGTQPGLTDLGWLHSATTDGKSTAAATKKIAISASATADIFWAFHSDLWNTTTHVTNDLLTSGLSTKQAATGAKEIAALWDTHKIKTQAQMALAVQNYISMTNAAGGIPPTLNQLQGVLAGTMPDLTKFAGKTSLLPNATQNLLNGLNNAAGIMVNIKALILGGSETAAGNLAKIRQWAMTGTGPHAAGGFIPPGMWGTKSEDEIVLGGRTGATVLTASQSRGAGRGVTINNVYNVGSSAQRADMEQVVQRNNRELIVALRSL
jgi:hypothetical protein